jgi:pyruvate,orthophosphate dikinase
MAKAKSSASKKQYVYFYGFGKKYTEGDASMKPILGGKGANLADMALAGLPVPPGFTVTTEACAYYSKNNSTYPNGMWDQVLAQLAKLEKLMGKKLGDAKDPLLVSVRSGAAISMPGMMDTVLNLGMNDKSVLGFIEKTNNARAGWDCYRRFLDMFGDVVMGPTTGLTHHDFEVEIVKLKAKYGAKEDTDLTADQLKELCEIYKRVYHEKVGKAVPAGPAEAAGALHQRRVRLLELRARRNTWPSTKSAACSAPRSTSAPWCTATWATTSGTGVAFTRDGATGEDKPMGEYLIDAQGEDVVAGIRTPKHLDEMASESEPSWKDADKELRAIMHKLERRYKYPQDVEFTVQEGKLWMLQTRNAKRTGLAGVRWAVEMATGKDFYTGKKQDKILSPKPRPSTR